MNYNGISNDGLDQGMGEAACYKGRLWMQIDSYPISVDQASSNNVQESRISHRNEYFFYSVAYSM